MSHVLRVGQRVELHGAVVTDKHITVRSGPPPIGTVIALERSGHYPVRVKLDAIGHRPPVVAKTTYNRVKPLVPPSSVEET